MTPVEDTERAEAILGDIATELELTGNRLVRLAARLRDVSAQDLNLIRRPRPRPDLPRLIPKAPPNAERQQRGLVAGARLTVQKPHAVCDQNGAVLPHHET